MFQLIFNNFLSGMKKFLLLFVMLCVGIMVPQGLHAADVYSSQTLTITTSDDGKTVTINSSQAGALWALLEKGEPRVKDPVIDAIKAVTGEGSEIVFSGQFSGDDLKKLHEPKPGQNCCVQETVDMENAEFKKRVDLTDAMDAYKISVDALPNQTEEQISDALKTKAQEVGITLADGDVAVVKKGPQEKLFYKYNSTTQQWSETSEPFFASPDRLDVCINGGQAWEKFAGAMVGGVPTLFQYKNDPETHDNKWVQLPSDRAYEDMTFSYWGSNIKTAITSKYADNDAISPEFCNGCTNLTTLTMNSGTFTSLGNSVDRLQTVNVNAGVKSLGNGMFNGKSSITTVTFEDGEKNLTVGEGCFNNCTQITELALPARLSSMGKQAFANTTGVTSLSIPENSRLTTIPEQAFKSCGNSTQAEFDITIPRSVTLIEDEGFGDMWRLKTVRFTGQQGDAPLVIETGAFAGGTESNYTLSDVYVDIDPDDRKLICEYGAFSYTSMEGQTSVANIEALTTLHFTEDYWDYYAGDWKKGVTFDQAALNSFKDGCDTTKKPMNADYMIGDNNQIHENNGHIPGKQPANGWQQFAKTNTGIDIIVPKGKFYRTYSTPSVLVKPSWMKIYRVKDFQDGFIEGKSDASSAAQANAAEKKALTEEITPSVTVDGKTYNIIPINTGVIRVDVRDKEAIYYILELERTSAANAYTEDLQYPYSESGNKVNYMYPTNGETATIGPVVKDGGTITHRIFGLLKVTQSGVIPQFSRAKVGTKLGDHRAYLKLPASKFHWRDEKNGSSQDATGNDVVVDENNTYAKISLFFDEDIEDVNGGIATEIINAIEEDMYKNDSFYTLQGVKVAKPTSKGVYIHNGKKIYIK